MQSLWENFGPVRLLILLAVLIAGGAYFVFRLHGPQPYPVISGIEVSSESAEITLEELLNVSYHPEPVYALDETFSFKDGIYNLKNVDGKDGNQVADYPDAAYSIRIDEKNIAFGDVNGDGHKDAVVAMALQLGGTGVFKSLAVFMNEDGLPHFVASEELGDRTRIEAVRVENGFIAADLLTHDSGEPRCCPTTKKTIHLELSDNQLREVQI